MHPSSSFVPSSGIQAVPIGCPFLSSSGLTLVARRLLPHCTGAQLYSWPGLVSSWNLLSSLSTRHCASWSMYIISFTLNKTPCLLLYPSFNKWDSSLREVKCLTKGYTDVRKPWHGHQNLTSTLTLPTGSHPHCCNSACHHLLTKSCTFIFLPLLPQSSKIE